MHRTRNNMRILLEVLGKCTKVQAEDGVSLSGFAVNNKEDGRPGLACSVFQNFPSVEALWSIKFIFYESVYISTQPKIRGLQFFFIWTPQNAFI